MPNETIQRLMVLPQYLMPQHLLSRAAGMLADCPWPIIKNTFTTMFINAYNVDMTEAVEPNPVAYKNFNDFFTRAIKESVRPITEEGIASPADGAISQIGQIDDQLIFQAKGHNYNLTELLGGSEERATPFTNGSFATVYLSPRDYHRVHMPFSGTLKEMIYVPGNLFSVNGRTAAQVPNLFARNERVISIFETEAGPMAVIMVGAVIVASIETVWAGLVAPPKRSLQVINYEPAQQQSRSLERGEEMGRFKLGSTAIVLFGKDTVQWDETLDEGSPIKMGAKIGTLR